jgi:methionyl-tRNA formyltransferase
MPVASTCKRSLYGNNNSNNSNNSNNRMLKRLLLLVDWQDMPHNITYPDLAAQLSSLGANMVIDTLRNYHLYSANATEQPALAPDAQPTVRNARKVSSDDARIDWNVMDADRVLTVYRALGLTVGTHTTIQRKRIKLLHLECYQPSEHRHQHQTTAVQPGTAIWDGGDRILIACCGSTWVACTKLQVEGSKALTAREFAAGRRLRRSSIEQPEVSKLLFGQATQETHTTNKQQQS